ncbi:glycoside hydrolase family 2 protein [Paenibacillus chartarius]|uniref:Glycoside hydrolase family 2 protein n=1 Tax=Paenibacillus chartarius TaxID=747481 RepID=A0ABV6DT13_9BACL
MNTNIPRPEHPRPDFERQNWLNLNGPWQFEFDDMNVGERESWHQDRAFTGVIQVPYCFQSKLSGIKDTAFHDVVWYQRQFAVPDSFQGKRVMLHFGAVDYSAKVWLNGQLAGEHTGGYTPFRIDITDSLREGENTVTVRVEDSSTNTSQPRGKQSWKPDNFGCWYTQVTGIWQTVWLEAVSATHLDKVKMTPDFDNGRLRLDVFVHGPVDGCELKARVSFEGHPIAEGSVRLLRSIQTFEIDVKSDHFEWKLAAWSPEHPNLYDIQFEVTRAGELLDSVSSYFGMRKISTRGGKVLLNNQPIYQKLILDQGYFDGGLLTAATDEDYIHDIRLIKEFGFNGVRKHQKAEDPRFLYWADKMGLLVWGEMGSPYEFDDRMIAANTEEWRRVVERDYNHPCIIVWTLMNESWGIPRIQTDRKQQHHTMSLYYMVKSYDDTRLVISNDGWEHTVSDLITFHDYMQDGERLAARLASKEAVLTEPVCSVGNTLGAKYMFAEGFTYSGQPILLSECCGVAYDTGVGWGYGSSVRTEEQFLERYRSILQAIHDHSYIAGFCTTQLTDVQQEINGLVTIDRKPKVDPARFAAILHQLN